MKTARVALILVLLTASVAAAQTPEKASLEAGGGLRFDLGTGRSQSGSWVRRESNDLESTIRHVITPVKASGGDRIEVFTDVQTNHKRATVRRSSEKRVYSAADMRPISARIDFENYDGAALQTGWRELKYEGTRVKGNAIDGKGGKFVVDKELPADALISPFVAFTFLHDDIIKVGSTIPFRTFNELTDAVEDGHIKIVKREKISVAGTDYDAWKVEIKSGRINSTAHYSTTIPRVLLRLKDSQAFQELIELSK